MKSPKYIFATLACAWLVSSCVTASEGRLMKADIQALRSQLDAVKSGVDEDREALQQAILKAQKKTAEVEQMLEQLNNAAHRTDADLGLQLDQLSRSMQELSGKFDEVTNRIDRLEKGRVGEGESGAVTSDAADGKRDGAAPPEAKVVLPADKAQGSALVQKLLQAKSEKQREDGKRLAYDYLVKWPRDEGYTDVVRLALGDRLVEEKAYQKAVVEYKKVLDAFPKGSRADLAMYKIANTFALMGYQPDAKVFYQELLRRFPKSGLVKDVKARLADLDKPKAGGGGKAPPKKSK